MTADSLKFGIACNRFGAGGGLERYALDIAAAIAARSPRPVAVYARKFDAAEAGGKTIEGHRINVSMLPGKWRDHVFSWRLQTLKRHSDVLIGCNRVRGADLAICGGTHRGYLAARGKAPSLADRWQIRLESDQYAGASTVVAHSALMRSELVSLYGIAEDRIALLYPPVDTRRFTPVDASQRQSLRRKHGFADDELVFLFPSSGHARKGLDLLARHFAILHAESNLPVTLAVAGRPVGRPLPRVREMGYVSDIESLYRAADYTVLASDYEPFGLVGVESVLCGTPLVFADNIACLEVIAPQAVLPFSRTDDDSVAAALREAVRRVRDGQARIDVPLSLLRYDPDVGRHAEALMALAEKARQR